MTPRTAQSHERADERNVCEAIYAGEKLCGDPATHRLTFGCVHEHMATKPLCENHDGQIRDMIERRSAYCSWCYEADERCLLSLIPARSGVSR